MGDVNPIETIADVATGGLYGAAKSGLDVATGKTDVLSGALGGLNQVGPWGASTYNIPGYGHQIAQTGNLIGAGAGIGGASGIGGGGFGAESSAPYYAGSNIPFVTDAAGNAGMSVAFDPITGAAGPGVGITPAGYASGASMGGATGAAAGYGAGGSGLGALTGASAGQQIMGLLGGASPLSMPGIGAQPAGVGGAGAASVNPAILGASQNDPHLGLAPRFEARQRGSREAPGLATMPLISEYYQQR